MPAYVETVRVEGLGRPLRTGHALYTQFDHSVTLDFVERELAASKANAIAAVIDGGRQWFLVWGLQGEAGLIELATEPAFDADLGWDIPAKHHDAMVATLAPALARDEDELLEELQESGQLFLDGEELDDLDAWKATLAFAKKAKLKVPELVLCHLHDGPRRFRWKNGKATAVKHEVSGDWKQVKPLVAEKTPEALFARLMYSSLYDAKRF